MALIYKMRKESALEAGGGSDDEDLNSGSDDGEEEDPKATAELAMIAAFFGGLSGSGGYSSMKSAMGAAAEAGQWEVVKRIANLGGEKRKATAKTMKWAIKQVAD